MGISPEPNDEFENEDVFHAFLNEYNHEINSAEAEIDLGDYLTHEEVEVLFANRRKNLD